MNGFSDRKVQKEIISRPRPSFSFPSKYVLVRIRANTFVIMVRHCWLCTLHSESFISSLFWPFVWLKKKKVGKNLYCLRKKLLTFRKIYFQCRTIHLLCRLTIYNVRQYIYHVGKYIYRVGKYIYRVGKYIYKAPDSPCALAYSYAHWPDGDHSYACSSVL